MAKLSPFHMLCPLIDQSSFLGVVNDSANDCVVVTLGRNIVIRYKISDRKQVGCWSTKEKLSSPVIYDPVSSQYVAVFNRNQIRTWKQNDEDLDSVKKYKFPEEIQCVLVSQETEAEPVVLFRSGKVCRLSHFICQKGNKIEAWKQKGKSGQNTVLKADEILEDWYLITCPTETYVLLSVRTPGSNKPLNFYLLKVMNEDKIFSVVRRFYLKLPNARLVGHTIIQRKNECYLLTLWSNGNIYSHVIRLEQNLLESEEFDINRSEQSKGIECVHPGSIIDSVKELLDVQNAVALVALGSDHLALYGADCNQTGAVVYIVDVHSPATGDCPWEALKESTARQPIKCFDAKIMPPRIWNASRHLFIPSSDGRLVFAPYELGPRPPLIDLLGCLGEKKHAANNNGMVNHNSQLQNVSWLQIGNTPTNMPPDSSKILNNKENNLTASEEMPEKMCLKLKTLIKEGYPEPSICNKIFPALIEDKDVESISWCLLHFHDIPEANLVELLHFFLSQNIKSISIKKEEHSPKLDNKSIISECNLMPSNIPEGPSKISPSEITTNPMMNGYIHSMDTDSSDSSVEDSEMKDNLDVGHTFVKGRRRSLRVMKINTPMKESASSKHNSSSKKHESNDAHFSDMEVDTALSPSNEFKRCKRNLSGVLSKLDGVLKGVENGSCKPNGLKGIVEESLVETHSLSIGFMDDKCIKEEQDERTCVEKLDDTLGMPYILIEEERRLEMLALPYVLHKPVERLLSIPVNHKVLLRPLRLHLPFHLALKLLRHILWILSSSKSQVSCNNTEIQFVEWVGYLLDAFCQQFTLSQDEEVLETLLTVKEVFDAQLQEIHALEEMKQIYLQINFGNTIKGNSCDKWYSIENFELY